MCHRVIVGDESHEGAVHMQISTIGIDLAKNVFQVHGVDAADKVVMNRALRRSQMLAFFAKLPPCLIGMEACATAHYWGRELRALGHTVRLMPPSYVKPYVKRGKNDSVDALPIAKQLVGRACVLCRSRLPNSNPYLCCTERAICLCGNARSSSMRYVPTWPNSGLSPLRGSRDCSS